MAASLKQFSTIALLDELARRSLPKGGHVDNDAVEHWCDDCEHFRPTDDMRHNPCEMGHKMDFLPPRDPSGDDWGHYRLICSDRNIRTLQEE